MKILAVDYGDTRTGIAVCDKGELLASPLTVIHERSRNKLAQKIAELVAEQGSEQIVIGNPLNMNGSAGPRSQLAHELAELIKALTAVPVAMWDERSTTVSATNILNQTDVRGKKRKAVIDAVAAVIILESYMMYRKNKSV